jgi:hypothetical protein
MGDAERGQTENGVQPVTFERVELLRHALGVQSVNGRWKLPYRNHFVASGDHVAAWDRFVELGLATKRGGNILTGGDPVYFVTDEGRSVAMEGLVPRRRWAYGTPEHGGAW